MERRSPALTRRPAAVPLPFPSARDAAVDGRDEPVEHAGVQRLGQGVARLGARRSGERLATMRSPAASIVARGQRRLSGGARRLPAARSRVASSGLRPCLVGRLALLVRRAQTRRCPGAARRRRPAARRRRGLVARPMTRHRGQRGPQRLAVVDVGQREGAACRAGRTRPRGPA